jgi:hypothetical protein
VSQPTWNPILIGFKVPQGADMPWTTALEYAPIGRLLKIEMVVDPNSSTPTGGVWTPRGSAKPCTADGEFCNGLGDAGLILSTAPRGALIGKIGGSTADHCVDTSQAPTRLLFSIGRFSVLTVPQTPTGALFLGINDRPELMGNVSGFLIVNIFESY